MNIIQALDDPKLLGGAIKDPGTFGAWRALLKAVYGLPMTVGEEETFRACTGLSDPPKAATAVLWLVIGRRGGKSFGMALIACYMAIFKDWRPFLSPGERAVVLLVAADREQAKILRRYVSGILETPLFRPHVEAETADSVELTGSVVIEVATCSYRTVRGRSVCVALLDEVAFWRSESTANPDREVWRAIRASMASFGSSALAIVASSPYAKRGILWDAYAKFYGEPDAVNLVWQAPTKVMNPTISDDFIAAEYEADPLAAASEYGAEFRNDVDAFISDDVVDAAIMRGVVVIPPQEGRRHVAFVDAASGGGADAMTMGIGFRDTDDRYVLACLAEKRPPFSPEDTVAEFAEILKQYGVHRVTGDRWAAGFVESAFKRHGIDYLPSEKPKSDLYRELGPLLNAGKVRLLDNARMRSQLLALERRVNRGGKDSIDHPPRGHDDLINAATGALVSLATAPEPFVVSDDLLALSALPIRLWPALNR